LEFHDINWITTAAWVQAIGSIIAIGIAIWVPFKLAKDSQNKQEAEKISLSRVAQVSLLPDLYRLRSSTKDFLDFQSGEKSFLGVDRSSEDFDDDFFSLVKEFANILKIAPESGLIQEQLIELMSIVFQTNELLAENTRLQRDGYHTAWINHKDLFVESAENINKLSDKVIVSIESLYV
jgi:hypothetical protein|tara:strand:- start:110 stop:646 length:537 start_codon:yes stop_codon:yes gene_type:complete